MVAGSEHGQNIHSRFLCQCKSLKIFLADKTKYVYNSPVNMQVSQDDYHADTCSLPAYNLCTMLYLLTVGLQAEECIHHSASSNGEHD